MTINWQKPDVFPDYYECPNHWYKEHCKREERPSKYGVYKIIAHCTGINNDVNDIYFKVYLETEAGVVSCGTSSSTLAIFEIIRTEFYPDTAYFTFAEQKEEVEKIIENTESVLDQLNANLDKVEPDFSFIGLPDVKNDKLPEDTRFFYPPIFYKPRISEAGDSSSYPAVPE